MSHTPNATTPVTLKWYGWTDPGKIRPNNEDAFMGLQFDGREVHHLGRIGEGSTSSGDFAFAVSDGMGGASAGEFASRVSLEKITTLLPRSFRRSAVGWETDFVDVLTELFGQIHAALTHLGGSYEECSGMEATLSLCWFTDQRVYFGHIGDSRLYYLPARDGGIRQLSHDDTHVGWLLRNGKINEREARSHPRRNALQKALGGANQFVDPQSGAVAFERGDIFLLCTDGLVHGLYEAHLIEILRSHASTETKDNPAERLVAESLNKDPRDNRTALVIQVG